MGEDYKEMDNQSISSDYSQGKFKNKELDIFDVENIAKDQLGQEILKLTENKKKELQKIWDDMNIIAEQTRTIQNQNYQNYIQNEQYIQNIKNMHYGTIDYINSLKIHIWKNNTGSTVYYRINAFGKKEKISTDDDFHALLKTNIHVFDSIDEVQIYDNTLLLVKSLLPTYKDDVFYPYISKENIILSNHNYRNVFQYSHFLCKRILVIQRIRFQNQLNQPYQPIQYQPIQYQPFISPEEQICNINQQLMRESDSNIVEFVKLMTQNEHEAFYILNWISYFFQRMEKTHTAIVLIGDTEVSNLLIEHIIQPIFALKKEYFASIDDDILKKPIETIIKDKIFYHIGELSKANTMNKKTSRLVLEVLKPNAYNPEFTIENNETYIWGQLIVTAEKETPFPFLKDSYSKCSVFKIKNMDTILKELNSDRITFESKIQDDLDNFSNILAQEPVYDNCLYVMPTDEKEALATMKNGVLMTPSLNKNIELFIKNIKEKNESYFKNIQKEDSDLYNELLHNFEENMIAQPLLNTYFNLIYEDIVFLENAHLLEVLKEKSEMFKKAPDDKSKYNGNKRYTITQDNW